MKYKIFDKSRVYYSIIIGIAYALLGNLITEPLASSIHDDSLRLTLLHIFYLPGYFSLLANVFIYPQYAGYPYIIATLVSGSIVAFILVYLLLTIVSILSKYSKKRIEVIRSNKDA